MPSGPSQTRSVQRKADHGRRIVGSDRSPSLTLGWPWGKRTSLHLALYRVDLHVPVQLRSDGSALGFSDDRRVWRSKDN